MKVIGVHAYGGGTGNFACPIDPRILNAFADIVSTPPSNILYYEQGIKYVQVEISPTTTYPPLLLGPEDAIPHANESGDDNLDGPFWEDL